MDRGYRGSVPKYVKCPDGLLADPDPAVKLMAARVWSRQETVNERFKNWAIQAERGFAAGAVLFDLGGNGAFWQKKGVTLRGLWISEKKEILHKLTVFDDGGDSNRPSLLSRRLASIRGPSLLIIEL